MLLAAPGELVAKDAVYAALWPGEGADDGNNLNQLIFRIRRALDPAGDGRAFIETVPRRGYRFVARVDVAEASVDVPAIRPSVQRRVRPAAFALIAAVLIALGWAGAFDRAALAALARAQRLAPGSAAILYCETLVALHAGRFADARAALEQLEATRAPSSDAQSPTPAGGEPRGAAAAGQ